MLAPDDEVLEFCERMLGRGAPALDACREAIASESGQSDRLALLGAASRACRARIGGGFARADLTEIAAADPRNEDAGGEDPLAARVARELAFTSAKLPERQREALALRELCRLSHHEIASVMGIGGAAVSPLLARARLRMRETRRESAPLAGCAEVERALPSLARRQDGEALEAEERMWLSRHLRGCSACGAACLAMIEASTCYRAWPLADPAADALQPLEGEPLDLPRVPPTPSIAVAPEPRQLLTALARPSWWRRRPAWTRRAARPSVVAEPETTGTMPGPQPPSSVLGARPAG